MYFFMVMFFNSFPIIYNLFSQYGWRNTVCDHLASTYKGKFGYWMHLFYFSKFYEFIDTWIVIARGRRPITLQVFHHCGAVLGVFLILVTKSTGGYLFMTLNSFIHGIMYLYYALSTIGLSFQSKFIITLLQMIQFVTGNTIVTLQMIYFGDCISWEDKFACIYHVVYTSILLIMFFHFYRQAHNAKTSSNKNLKKQE